jgi:hypothetical protein
LLSVVVVRFAGGRSIDRCLQALAAQSSASAFEVIVAEEAGGEAMVPPPDSLTVRVVEGPRGCGPARLRSLGVRASVAPIVATIEDHIVPANDWCSAVLAAHARHAKTAVAVGGTIAPDPSLRGTDLAFYLLAYARYLPPLPTGPSAYLSDCHVTYRRSALDAVADVWGEAFVETVVHDALRARGGGLVLDGALRATQGRAVDLRMAQHEQRVHGEEYARGRMAGAPLLARFVRAGVSVALPAVLSSRSVARAISRGCPPVPVLGAFPSLFRLAASWSAGEVRGYLASSS